MPGLARCSISIDKDLLRAFDEQTAREGYPTRSEAVKALIRKALIEREWERGGQVAGALVMVYDHHRPDLVHQLTHVQHDHSDAIISSQHVHLDHDNCLEMVTVKGDADDIRLLLATIRSVKGIKHTALVMTSAGVSLP